MKAKFSILIIAGMALGFSSCKKYLDINQNPNQANSSTAALQLPTSQLYIGNAIGDRLFQQASFWCQYYTGGPGVSLGDFDKNTMSTTDANQAWNNIYRANSNLDYIIKKTKEPYYAAVAHILTAYNMQLIVDLFGNAPYTEALKGDISDGLVVSPKYDNAKDIIYPDIESRINAALQLLDTVNASLGQPGQEDLIYPFNATEAGADFENWKNNWRRFGKSLLLKIYLREGNSAKFSQLYTSPDADFITTNDNIAKINYTGDAQGSNPLWNDLKSSIGNYFAGSKASIDYLKNTADPRIDFFYNTNGAGLQVGLSQGDIEHSPASADYSKPNGAKISGGGLIFSPTAPVILMSSWEVNLIIAEAAVKGWITEDAETFYTAAVYNNAQYLGVSDSLTDAYLNSSGKFNAANPVKSIALQKWVCMNGLQPIESWIETRRSDSPSTPIFQSPGGIFLVPTQNVLGGNVFPSVLFYPATEQDLNKNFPGQHLLTDKVFWDN